jgi:hypothetical protein
MKKEIYLFNLIIVFLISLSLVSALTRPFSVECPFQGEVIHSEKANYSDYVYNFEIKIDSKELPVKKDYSYLCNFSVGQTINGRWILYSDEMNRIASEKSLDKILQKGAIIRGEIDSYDSIIKNVYLLNGSVKCAKEGEAVNPEPGWFSDLPDECCKGLKHVGPYEWTNEGCSEMLGPGGRCIYCGDGICGYNEYDNICTCPEDCKKAKKDCAEENEKIAKKDANIWSLTWLPEKCCKGLEAVDNGWNSQTYTCNKIEASELTTWQKILNWFKGLFS